jgi:hypothetical protein
MSISVSPRGVGRTSAETEMWSICRLLATLNRMSRLGFPLKLVKSERPDFVISFNGDEAIGIEVTEVVDQDFARVQTLPEAREPASVLDRSLFRWGDARRSLAELREIASQTRLTGPGWSGFAVESEFATAMQDRIAHKTRKLAEDTYSRFGEDWLLIYNNLMLPQPDLPLAVSYLRSNLARYWSGDGFTRVFIESQRSIVEMTQDALFTHRLRDLW